MEVKKLLTTHNRSTSPSTDRIQYIVIHYVGAIGGAEANCKYYASRYIGASAHYFVGFDGEIWQSVEDKDIAWHCGAKRYVHPDCRNANSIGIELCVRSKGSNADTSKDWYFEDATVTSAIALTKELMERYHVPAGHVIRHHDVTGKICPNPYVYNHTKHTWDAFKEAVAEQPVGWIKDDVGWWYRHPDGSYTVNDWEQIHSKWYWFNGAGYAVQESWKKGKGGRWYYLGDDGIMLAHCIRVIKNEIYAFGSDGAMLTGEITLRTNEFGAIKF